jgi:hypothetical protein
VVLIVWQWNHCDSLSGAGEPENVGACGAVRVVPVTSFWPGTEIVPVGEVAVGAVPTKPAGETLVEEPTRFVAVTETRR